MIKVQLTRGFVSIVDDEDGHLVLDKNWYATNEKANARGVVYAARNTPRVLGRQNTFFLHRLILDAPRGVPVDHINHDGLDNRRANLRLSDHSKNAANMRPRNGVEYVGVRLFRGKYVGFVYQNRQQFRTPAFDDAKSAALARDTLAQRLFEGNAYLNFPDAGGSP